MADRQDDRMLEAGDAAPAFELRGTVDGDIGTFTLSEYTDAGNWALVTFYAFDFHPICTAGMCAIQDAAFFDVYDDVVALGVSGDGVHAHAAFAERNGIHYPLLADTGRDVAADYGVVQDRAAGMRRVHRRSVFLVDPSGTIRFSAGVDADSADDVDLGPVNDVLQEIRGSAP